jgi:acetyl esterase/lipase
MVVPAIILMNQNTKLRRQRAWTNLGAWVSLLLILLSPIELSAKDANSEKTTPDKIISSSELRNVSYSDTQNQPFSLPQQTWQYGSDENQFIHYWKPYQEKLKNAKAIKSPVILIHGGCWLSAFDIRHTYSQASAIAKAGHPVYNIEYRRTGSTGGGWPITFIDIKAALSKIRSLLKQASEENLAAEINKTSQYLVNNRYGNQKINILGHSAGGHLALLAAAQSTDIWPQDWQIHVFGLAAIVDIKSYAQGTNSCQSVTSDFMQGFPADKPGAYYLANPKEHILQAPQLTSVTLLQGSVDNIVPRGQANHPDAKTVLIDNVGHFDWLHGKSAAFTHLLTLLK